MMKLPVSKTYHITLKIHQEITSLTKRKNVTRSTINKRQVKKERLEEREDFIPQNFTVVYCGTFEGLSDRAKLLVTRIIAELKSYNALWEFDHRQNTRDSQTITELRKKNILIKTETTSIHYVNPKFIRRGRIELVVAAMLDLLENCSKVGPEWIKSLRSRDETNVNQFDLLSL